MFESHFKTKGIILEQRTFSSFDMPHCTSDCNTESFETKDISLFKSAKSDLTTKLPQKLIGDERRFK